MASLFLSYSGTDAPLVERFRDRLRAQGYVALFVAYDATQGIPAGQRWERELYVELRRADAVVFLASPTSVASHWCFAELTLARSIGKPVFPVRVSPGAELSLLDDVQWIELRSQDDEEGYERLWQGLRRAGLSEGDTFAWDPTRSPYPGLEAFSSKDAAVFFGRDQEVAHLLELFQPTLQHQAGRFVAVVGPSGSGKSSLVRAGLLPRLERLARWVVLAPLVPGREPVEALARSLAQALSERDEERSAQDIAKQLRVGGLTALVGLAQELCGASPAEAPSTSVLVVIDQAEELITRTGAHERQVFLELLHGALSEDSPIWVLATLRSEFLASSPDHAGLAEVVDDFWVVSP